MQIVSLARVVPPAGLGILLGSTPYLVPGFGEVVGSVLAWPVVAGASFFVWLSFYFIADELFGIARTLTRITTAAAIYFAIGTVAVLLALAARPFTLGIFWPFLGPLFVLLWPSSIFFILFSE